MFHKKNITLRPAINADARFIPLSSDNILESTCEDPFILTSPRRPATVWIIARQNKPPLCLPREQKLSRPLFVFMHNSFSQMPVCASVAVSDIILVFKAQRGDCFPECQIFIKVELQMARSCTSCVGKLVGKWGTKLQPLQLSLLVGKKTQCLTLCFMH